MNDSPLVSVICLSHNHGAYVSASIQSVLDQTYKKVELIVVDDGSEDDSKKVIREKLRDTSIQFIDIPQSIGNCKAFNRGFFTSKGDYIIDLAADDLLNPKRIEMGLKTFAKHDIGVEFCNVLHIDPNGEEIGTHFTGSTPPQGDIYGELIQRYFISPPGMMMGRKVLEELNGYDESLSYEDFDFWIRSSRNHHYAYTDEVLVKKTILNNSLSAKQFRFRSPHQKSTLRVCQKIKELNQTQEEEKALRKRCLYEIKQCLKQGNLGLIPSFLRLLT